MRNKRGKPKFINKAHAQRRHAAKRAEERYGCSLNRKIQDILVAAIQSGDSSRAKHLEKQSNRISIWVVRYNDNYLPLVYDRNRKVVVSVLPDQALIDRGFDPETGTHDPSKVIKKPDTNRKRVKSEPNWYGCNNFDTGPGEGAYSIILTKPGKSDKSEHTEGDQAAAHIPDGVSEEVRGCTAQGRQLTAAERELRESATETIPQAPEPVRVKSEEVRPLSWVRQLIRAVNPFRSNPRQDR